ncbi:class I SAM-dependent methyltransferase [uncultured Sphingomonas sp.]|uniref:class I SAM-dependent methyltransferase n=1 Tax=uncultured Sphingomonas sp. TaxID=158754 RepID=UPI0035CC58EB
MTALGLQKLSVPPFNAHYEGNYDDAMLVWRGLGAQDKVRNMQTLLGDNGVDRIDTVLEAGCGTGAVLLEVQRRGIGRTHHGVDVADPGEHPHPGVAEAESLTLSRYGGVRLPFDDDSFDLVFASHVLEHVPDERGFLGEVRRVARRWVYIEVPCELHLRTSIGKLQSTLEIGHINAYTPESFALTLSSAGLNPKAMHIFDHSLALHAFGSSRTKARLKAGFRGGLLRLSPTLASRLFTYHVGALIDLSECRSDT